MYYLYSMKYILTLLSVVFCSSVLSQVYTFDYFAHTDYVNKEPGQVVLLNDNWENKIDYVSSGNGYHITYIYNVINGTVETIERDDEGNSIPEYNVIDDIDVLYSDSVMLHVFNPSKGLFTLFYFNEQKIPYLLVEDLDGIGFFATDDEFTYHID